MLKEINTKEELMKLTENETAIMVYFYNNKCAPCISLRPKVEKMVIENYPKCKLLFIDSEKYPEITAGYGVFSNPTIIIFLEGREYRRESKYISIAQLSESLSRPYNLIFEQN
jgi:thioredoxin